ncbi:GNAT family N-acetyltransferase [Halobacillus litoralis]|uniref:GNAT family N-acetyltransferase n=1 Tax=Halobacillus litoralis TaxID=45668 RepID=A0A845DV46_9BACI|nr:GNAT family protein [Halobacillus litoralis]MYL20988.1 GNAT family N-acetyltransferase [Halobacillus litoralis]
MIKGEHVYIRSFNPADAEQLTALLNKNRSFLQETSTGPSNDEESIKTQRKAIEKWIKNIESDLEYNFGIFKRKGNELIGKIGLFHVVRGPLQKATLGYFLDEDHNGKGYTTEAGQLMVDYGFKTLHLHRIEAGVMPGNIGSLRVLEKSGFHKEGIAKKSVKINGQWEDHQMLAVINPYD